MKLRHLIVLTVCVIVITPMTLFWAWPYSKALESEVEEVSQKHLVIAKNLSATFERYYQDITSLFSIVDLQSKAQINSPEFKALLASYKFTEITQIEESGKVKNCLFTTRLSCPQKIDQAIVSLAIQTLQGQAIKLSTVTEDSSINSGPILLVVKKDNRGILLAYLSTEYIIEMGKRVAFGEKGHAAIIDQAGNVLAHPLDSWIQERKNIAQISTVKKMLEDKTGVEKFYSPALKGNMIAGYTHVPNADWGVMVPQPIKELEDKAKAIDGTAIFVMLLGLGLALLITIPVSYILIKPIENLSRVIKSIEKGGTDVYFKWDLSRVIPKEIRELKQSFSNMMDTIETNKQEISKLAYYDSNSGLPNRNYFYRLAHTALKNMFKLNQKGALIFIDFDGFKNVNDIYGHRVGDELLYRFGQRLAGHLSFDPTNFNTVELLKTPPKVIPARLGGDEFVVLLQDIQHKTQVEEIIKQLFKTMFSRYSLSEDLELTLTGSIGISLFPEHGHTYDELMKSADMAMYKAKSAGKNCIHFSDSI